MVLSPAHGRYLPRIRVVKLHAEWPVCTFLAESRNCIMLLVAWHWIENKICMGTKRIYIDLQSVSTSITKGIYLRSQGQPRWSEKLVSTVEVMPPHVFFPRLCSARKDGIIHELLGDFSNCQIARVFSSENCHENWMGGGQASYNMALQTGPPGDTQEVTLIKTLHYTTQLKRNHLQTLDTFHAPTCLICT